MKLKRFEDLDAWKEARRLKIMINDITNGPKAQKDYVFCSQIRSAALSIMANLAEGFESVTISEKLNFMNYARRSCGELRSHLYSALDDKYVTQQEFSRVMEQITIVGKLITGLISYFRRKNHEKRY